jgi:hypothetical protein
MKERDLEIPLLPIVKCSPHPEYLTFLLDIKQFCILCHDIFLHTEVFIEKNVTCYNQMIVAIVDVLTSFIFIFTNDNR